MELTDEISAPVSQFVLDFSQKHPKLIVHKLDVWDCGCICCEKMRPMYHDVAYKQVLSAMEVANKRYNKLSDEFEILKYEHWQLEENKILMEQKVDELNRLLFKKRERSAEDVFSEPLPKS